MRNRSSACAARPYIGVWLATQAFVLDGGDVVPDYFKFGGQAHRQVLVQLDPHRISGLAGTGKSSSAEAAAKEIAARTSSTFKLGKSDRISSTLSPSAKLARIVRSVTRVPRNTGSPPQVCGSRTMRSWRKSGISIYDYNVNREYNDARFSGLMSGRRSWLRRILKVHKHGLC
jgi:hypothetical protein